MLLSTAVNGDVKTKAAPSTTRTPAKPLTNGTTSSAPAKPPAARQPLSTTRTTPLKSKLETFQTWLAAPARVLIDFVQMETGATAKTSPTKSSGPATAKSSATGTRTVAKPAAATTASTTAKVDTKK